MYVLELNQEGRTMDIGLFETIEEGRQFLSGLEAYKSYEEDGFLYETLDPKKIPEYFELDCNGNLVPFTKFMFESMETVDVDWRELPVLSKPGKGIVDGATRVDAYSIENKDVKTYIERREARYARAKKILEDKGYEVTRSFFGSEDGEAILYRRKGDADWHFLTHLDPSFVETGEVEDWTDEIESI